MGRRIKIIVVVGSVTLSLLAVAGWSWRGSGLRQAIGHGLRVVLDHPSTTRNGDFTNVIFLHHSTGRNLIRQGGVRERLSAAGFQFWDHDYNREGLTRPDGTRTGYSYNIPDDNTDPGGFARIFRPVQLAWGVEAERQGAGLEPSLVLLIPDQSGDGSQSNRTGF